MTQEVAALGIALFWIYMCLGVAVVGYAIRMKIRDMKELHRFRQFERTQVSSSEVENQDSN